MRRVGITGIGIVSGVGLDRESFWQTLTDGRSGITPIQSVDCTRFKFANGAEVRGFDPLRHFTPKEAMQLDRAVQLAGAAAAEAMAGSGARVDAARSAVFTGCSLGGKISEDETFRQLYAEKKTRLDPLTIPRVMANGAASWLSIRYGIKGPCLNFSTACASAAHAIGHAFWMIRSGVVDLALAGGTETPFTPGMLRAWESMRVVSPDTCRPFCIDRRGMVLGEGAAMLVFEPLDAARERGAKVFAEICGFGMSADASHITLPAEEGAAAAMASALADAGLALEQVGYINAHGTGTAANDSTEARAIRRVFGASPPVSSTKSMHGHALGASPALEAVATVLALHSGVLPPTANFTAPDPACPLDVIANLSRPARVEAAISNSFAFGGLNAVLAFRAAAE